MDNSARVKTCLAISLIAGVLNMAPALAQAAGANQQIFRDEEEMLRINNAQINQMERQEQNAQAKAQSDEERYRPYRAYAEKRIKELEKLKAAGGSPVKSIANVGGELQNLQNWLKRDDELLQSDQNAIAQIDRSIANLRQTSHQTMQNLGNDITAMRQSVQDERDDVKFQQMMQINQFNELQSEMGAASWGTPPRDGTFNSVGGYGFGGGYGYSYGGGRRW